MFGTNQSSSAPDLQTATGGQVASDSDLNTNTMTRSATEATSLLGKKQRTLDQMGVLRSICSSQAGVAATAGGPLGHQGLGSFASLAMMAVNEESSEEEGEKRDEAEKTSNEKQGGAESDKPMRYTSTMKRRKAKKNWGKLRGSFGMLLDSESSQTATSIGKGLQRMASGLSLEASSKEDLFASSSEEEDSMQVKNLFDMIREFGVRPLIMIVIGGWFVDGLCNSVVGVAIAYLYSEHNLPATTAQVYQAIAKLPGGLTVAVGLFTIFFNVNGYRNWPYMTLTTLLAMASYYVLYVTPPEDMDPKLITVLCFFGALQATTAGCLIKGDLAAKVKSHPVYTQALVCFISSGSALMGSIGGVLYGPLSNDSNEGALNAIAFCGICSALLLPPAIFNFLGEQPDHTQIMIEKLKKQWELPFVAFIICGLAILQSALSLSTRSTIVRWFSSLALQGTMFALVQIFLRPEIRRACSFLITCYVICPSFSMAIFRFYVDSPSHFPGGPNFTPNFYTTWLGLVGIVSMVCGQIVIYPYLNRLPYNKMFFVEGVTKVLIALPQLIIFTRWNLHLGISDEVFSIVYQVYSCFPSMLLGIPMTSYFAKVCPSDLEITTFALMISVYCIAYGNESYFGAVLMEWFGVEPCGADNEEKQFDNLWILALIQGVAPMVHYKTMGGFFLPRKFTDQAVLIGHEGSAVAGSRFRKWIADLAESNKQISEANP